jgi:hypothetical protein
MANFAAVAWCRSIYCYILCETMPKISGKTSAPDEIWTLSRPQQQGDKMKISLGMSQSPRGDESIEIVQYCDADFAGDVDDRKLVSGHMWRSHLMEFKEIDHNGTFQH